MVKTSSEIVATLQLPVDKFELRQVDPEPPEPRNISQSRTAATTQGLELTWWTAIQDEILLYSWRNFAFHYPCLKDCLIPSVMDKDFEWREILNVLGPIEYTLKVSIPLQETYWRRFGYLWMQCRLEELLIDKAMDIPSQIEISPRLLNHHNRPDITCHIIVESFRNSSGRSVLDRTGGGICWYCMYRDKNYILYCRHLFEDSVVPICGGCGAAATRGNIIWKADKWPNQDSVEEHRLNKNLTEWVTLKARKELLSETDPLNVQQSEELARREGVLETLGRSKWKEMSQREYYGWKSKAEHDLQEMGPTTDPKSQYIVVTDRRKFSARAAIQNLRRYIK